MSTATGDWLERRIPEPLLDQARRGAYRRESPYPVDALVDDFAGERCVTRRMRIVTLGSCFAQELARWLDGHGYTRSPHHWGVIYNPASLRQIVQYSVDPDSWNPLELTWDDAGGHFDPYRKADDHSGPLRLGATLAEAERALAEHRLASRATLEQADLAVLTLGLTELWRNRLDRAAFFAVPPRRFFAADLHEFHALTFDEVREHLRVVTARLRELNPSLRILLSVSPIPLSISFRPSLGPYVATRLAKSVLHAAVLEHAATADGVLYMPSYEIATSDPGRFFEPDGRHVNRECVATIMRAFERLFVA